MRLYLSSHRLGHHADRLLALAQDNRRCVVIGNALDYLPDFARRFHAWVAYDPVKELCDLGFDASPLDLRDYFNDPSALRRDLDGTGLIWVRGGNVFLLRKAMRLSGFDALIGPLLENDTLVYGGYSAGAAVIADSLRGLHVMDDADISAVGYPDAVQWDGLGLIDTAIVPHVASDHRESRLADDVIAHMTRRRIPFIPLSDGEVVIVDGTRTEVLR